MRKLTCLLILAILMSGCATLDPTYYTRSNSPGYTQQVHSGICEKCGRTFTFSQQQYDSIENIQCPYDGHVQNLKMAANRYQVSKNDYSSFPNIHNRYIITGIILDPPGAKIEINNQYVGDTPLTLHINRIFNSNIIFDKEMGYWTSFDIKAYPVHSGQYTQTKYIDMNEPTPTKVYFNMNLGPATREYNININQ